MSPFSGCNVTRRENEHPERDTYTVSSGNPMCGLDNPMYDCMNKPMRGVDNPMYDCMNWGNQLQPAGGFTTLNGFSNSLPASYEQIVKTKIAHSNHCSANTTEEEIQKESFERVIDNDLYSLGSLEEGDETVASGEQVQNSNDYAYVAWDTTHQ